MSLSALESTINAAFDARDSISTATKGEVRDAVDHALELLDKGEARVAEREADGKWKVNQWLKKAVLLSFRLNDMSRDSGRPRQGRRGGTRCRRNSTAGARTVFATPAFARCPAPSCAARPSSRRNVVLMPSFVNLGAYVDEATMVDTWATVGSCAQIGKRVHLSGGVGIGGVLEPLQAEPVIIEDDCFIGARSEVAEGVIVRKGAVLAMGVFLGASTKIVDRDTGEIFVGEVPEYAVVVPGTLPAAPAEERPARPLHRLRRHRQAGRRAHPRQNQHQRAAAGLIRSSGRLEPRGVLTATNQPDRRICAVRRIGRMDYARSLFSFKGRINRARYLVVQLALLDGLVPASGSRPRSSNGRFWVWPSPSR